MERETPEFYKSILVFAESEDDSPTTTRIGGRYSQPRLAFSYLLSARRLIVGAPAGRLGEVAAPIAYLQRHAFELGMKDLIEVADDVRRSRDWLAELRRSGTQAKLPEKSTPIRGQEGHRFDALVKKLREALEAVEYEANELLHELGEVGKLLTGIEDGEHTRFRYGNFAGSVELKLGETQERLETLFARELWIRDIVHETDPRSLLAELALEVLALGQQICTLEAKLGML